MRDISVIIELQTATSSSGGKSSRLTSKAWTKLDLFDLHGRLLSGRWRTVLRLTPINPRLATQDLDTVAQVTASMYMYMYLVTVRKYISLTNYKN